MNILITGAAGFIGKHLVEKLAVNHKVICFVKTSSKLGLLANLNVDFIYGDIQNTAALKNAFNNIEIIYHLAVNKDINKFEGSHDENYVGTKNIIDSIISNKIKLKKFIYINCLSAFGPVKDFNPKIEDDPPMPVGDFGLSKLKAQKYIELHSDKIPSIIATLPFVYGPGDLELLPFIRFLRTGFIPQIGGKHKYGSFIYVEDAVDGIITCAKKDISIKQHYFISNEKPNSWGEIARIVINQLGKKGIHLGLPVSFIKWYEIFHKYYTKVFKKNGFINKQRILEMSYDFWICSPRKIKQELNWSAKTPIEEGIKETLNWYLSKGLL